MERGSLEQELVLVWAFLDTRSKFDTSVAKSVVTGEGPGDGTKVKIARHKDPKFFGR